MTSGRPGRDSNGEMNAPRDRTPEELDALLNGAASGDPRLDQLLSAARAPGRPIELDAAVPAVTSTPRPASRARRVLTRVSAATVTTKVVAAVVGVAVASAAAVAGATGHLPGQSRHHHTPAPVSSSPNRPNGSGRSGSPSAPRPDASATPGGSAPSSGVPASSTPSVVSSSSPSSVPTAAGTSGSGTSPGSSRSVTTSPSSSGRRSTPAPTRRRRGRPSDVSN